MRPALLIWCVFGAALIGLKVHIDQSALKYSDVAVRTDGREVYHIPRSIIESGGWRDDLLRFAGCWDAREAGVLPMAASLAGCEARPALRLRIPAEQLGAEASAALNGQPLNASFWQSYTPPAAHMAMLSQAWAGQGEWAGRYVVPRDDWQSVRLETVNTPWVPLLVSEPASGDPAVLALLYAGRCYRPDAHSDIGMTCSVVIRLRNGAAIEYEVGPDQIGAFLALRSAVLGRVAGWRTGATTGTAF